MVQRDLIELAYGFGETIMDIAKRMRQLLIGSAWGAGEWLELEGLHGERDPGWLCSYDDDGVAELRNRSL